MIEVLITIIVVGFLVWIADLLPINDTFKTILKGTAIIGMVVWLLRFFFGGL